MNIYATSGTAAAIKSFGTNVSPVKNATESDEIYSLMESGKINYIIYTGAVKDSTMGDYIALHRKATAFQSPVSLPWTPRTLSPR